MPELTGCIDYCCTGKIPFALFEIPFQPFLARKASGTPRDRWPYEVTAKLSACVVVLLRGKRSGYQVSITRRCFPGVSNGRHRVSSQPFFNLARRTEHMKVPGNRIRISSDKFTRIKNAPFDQSDILDST